jgi:transposase
MQTVTTIGLDIAKSVFQVHGVGSTGQVVIRRQLKRRRGIADSGVVSARQIYGFTA